MSSVETTNSNVPVSIIEKWDKTFAESPKVDHREVTFQSHYGITLVDNLYLLKDCDERKLAAIATNGPFGAVREQSSGLYAQTLAEQGFVTLSFGPSYTGESGGYPRDMASPGINTEDFGATIDSLGLQKEVDRSRIGLLGIYGWGGMALNDAAMDTHVKAVVTSVIYDISRAVGHGVGDDKDRYTAADHQAVLQYLSAQRWKDAANGTSTPGGRDICVDDKGSVSAADRILPETLPASPSPALGEFFDHYRMPRGFHTHSINSTGVWDATMPLSSMDIPSLSYASEVTIPTLIVTGERAHSCYFAEDAFETIGSKKKALMIVPGANHIDLYDNVAGKIPFATFTRFFKTNLQ